VRKVLFEVGSDVSITCDPNGPIVRLFITEIDSYSILEFPNWCFGLCMPLSQMAFDSVSGHWVRCGFEADHFRSLRSVILPLQLVFI
jgi:hypothetical protein